MLYAGGDEMRYSTGLTGLKAICPSCDCVALMEIKSICGVCSSVDILCSHCAALSVVYKRGVKRG
jgi:hypothetical protein